ncbi:MAG: molybdopterin biosynthesis protein [Treponema sp.]|nr:molybdopterin biosynthesis protein [Treponema sp.]
MAERNLYLSNIPVEEAIKKYLNALDGKLMPAFEEIPSEDSLDRVTACAVYARCCSPLFNAAAMDGIAVKAAATYGARESNPLTLKAGQDFIPIDTGDPVYPPYDAVIMAEDLIQSGDEKMVKILESAAAWQHIRPIGEDIVTGEMIIPGRHRIRPIDMGVLFSGGINRVKVYSKPVVAVIPTGSELIEAAFPSAPSDALLKEGEIIESNSRMFAALVNYNGGTAERFGIIPDNYELLKEAVYKAAGKSDMVIVNAGSSAGAEDFTVHVLREIGEVVVHGVAMKPGKPVILAIVNNKPVIGTPGYPVSAYLSYVTFAAPVLSALTGRADSPPQTVQAVISRRIVSSLKHREYVRVKAGRVGGRLVASPLARGAGAAMSLVRADGFCVIDQHSEGIEAGESASVELYRSMDEIEHTLVAAGSHDLILDVIADMMSGPAFLASSHVGSAAGLTALKRGECHIAPVHLLDEESGVYNAGWIKKMLPQKDVSLIKGVGRVQGLIIQKNNPLGIKSIADICRCRYINRQRGAGTRLFLDFLLKKEGMDSGSINGYTREAATHMAVAASVQGGGADAGMGIASAAKALDLDFIPLGEEEYDFAVLSEFLELKEMRFFLQVLKSPEFIKKLEEFGPNAYTWANIAQIIKV